jgi:hypothetical protein
VHFDLCWATNFLISGGKKKEPAKKKLMGKKRMAWARIGELPFLAG